MRETLHNRRNAVVQGCRERNAGNVGNRALTLSGGVREGISWEVTVELCLEG